MTRSLFERVAQDQRFPETIIKAAAERNGLRYLLIGDDPNWIVVLGHPAVDTIIELVRVVDDGLYPEDEVTVKDLSYTWARLLTKCPDHEIEDERVPCHFCHAGVSPEEWWLDWDKAEGNRETPGYFPVVVWETGA